MSTLVISAISRKLILGCAIVGMAAATPFTFAGGCKIIIPDDGHTYACTCDGNCHCVCVATN